jgi:hypothetical protein
MVAYSRVSPMRALTASSRAPELPEKRHYGLWQSRGGWDYQYGDLKGRRADELGEAQDPAHEQP